MVHGQDRARVEATIKAALGTGSTYECEYRAVRPDGSIVWITERGRALQNDDDGVERLIGVSRDVSGQRRAEQAREHALINERRARDEAERQSRIKDEFLATLSHELRTPMNAILGWLSMLKGEAVRNPDQAMAVIQRNAQIQAKLIEDLLEMNKLTSGDVRLEIGALDLGATLDGTIESLRPTADTKGILLGVTKQPAVPMIQADARRVQQVFWNLLHNAVKFTRPGGRVDVSLSSTRRVCASARQGHRPGDRGGFPPVHIRPLPSSRSLDDPGSVGIGDRAVDRQAPRGAARRSHRGVESRHRSGRHVRHRIAGDSPC